MCDLRKISNSFLHFSLCILCVCICVDMLMPWCASRSQRTTCRIWFSPSTVRGPVIRSNLLSGLVARTFVGQVVSPGHNEFLKPKTGQKFSISASFSVRLHSFGLLALPELVKAERKVIVPVLDSRNNRTNTPPPQLHLGLGQSYLTTRPSLQIGSSSDDFQEPELRQWLTKPS